MTMEGYWLWLNNIPGMWHGKMKKLINIFGSPKEIYDSSTKAIYASSVLKENEVDVLVKSKQIFDIEKQMEILEKKAIRFITIDSPKYPEKLKRMDEKPYCLYIKGKIPCAEKAASVVGARDCTNYGRQLAKQIGKELSLAGVDVISGMARGIDTYSHLGAMEGNGNTYAVLGCGVDVCYPTENIELYEAIIEKGGIISEYPPGTKPEGWRFPQRNRIISGLSDCVIVVEARAKSGSLITAELAMEQGIDVAAVPGRITDSLSEGCNMLIRDGAGIVTNIKEVIELFDITYMKNNEILNNVLEKDFEVVYSETDLLPISIDELAQKTGMPIERVYGILLDLQLKNLVYEPAKNYYARKM